MKISWIARGSRKLKGRRKVRKWNCIGNRIFNPRISDGNGRERRWKARKGMGIDNRKYEYWEKKIKALRS